MNLTFNNNTALQIIKNKITQYFHFLSKFQAGDNFLEYFQLQISCASEYFQLQDGVCVIGSKYVHM